MLDFDQGAAECMRCTDDVSHSRCTMYGLTYVVYYHFIVQETVRVSYSQPSVSGVVLQEKAFEFDWSLQYYRHCYSTKFKVNFFV